MDTTTNEAEMVADIWNALSCKEDQTQWFIKTMLELVVLFDGKQHDYGPGNISAFGEFGVLVRSSDKLERLKRLLNTGESPKNESLEDSWKDLATYGVIALMVHRGEWDKHA